MVQLDDQLLQQAREFLGGGNVDHIKATMVCYEASVRKAQDGRPYDSRFEKWLREFVYYHGTRERLIQDFEAVRHNISILDLRSREIDRRIQRVWPE